MEKWWEVLISTAIVIVLVIIFKVGNIPSGAIKVLVYLALAGFPTLIIQLRHFKVVNKSVSYFVFALILNSFMIVLFAMLGLFLLSVIFKQDYIGFGLYE